MEARQRIRWAARHPVFGARDCCDCGNLLSLERSPGFLSRVDRGRFDSRLGNRQVLNQSGVWRFREGVLTIDDQNIVSHPEGSTRLYHRPQLSQWANVEQLHLKHEGENPTGSFKDRGITVEMSQAMEVQRPAVACASTGNTSASLAAYAAQAGKKAVGFVPEGKISLTKMGITLDYGALCLKVEGDFDAAMRLVREACQKLG